jgi:predicted nucleic acid-binding protein
MKTCTTLGSTCARAMQATLSLVDAISFIVMRQRRLAEAFAIDVLSKRVFSLVS